MTVIFHVYLWHLVTLEEMNFVHVKTHSIYQKRWWMPYIHSIGYKHEFSPNKKCCHIPVIWQVYDTTCHMTGIWQSYTLSKLYGDSRCCLLLQGPAPWCQCHGPVSAQGGAVTGRHGDRRSHHFSSCTAPLGGPAQTLKSLTIRDDDIKNICV